MCQYSLGIPSYQLTYPPPTYPPTAPYASLTTHYKALVKAGRLHRYLIKTLLYSDYYATEIDISDVVFRGRHKITGRHARSHTNNTSSEECESSVSFGDASSVQTDDDIVSCVSKDFGYVKFETGKVLSSTAPSTDYETFVDYGEATASSTECSKQKSLKSSVLINRDSDGSFVFPNRIGETYPVDDSRESLLIHSKPIKLLTTSGSSSRETVVHTSTAKLQIGGVGGKPKQPTLNAAHISGYDKRITGTHMACENLLNLDESIKLKSSLVKRPTIEDRHSMPTLFVGNRFNSSDVTEVYIPSYKDKQNVQMTTITTSTSRRDDESPLSSTSTTTHSSSIDLPAIVPAPDQITAELLYNYNPLDYFSENITFANVIKPPSMFDNSQRLSLNREISPFNKHSLNSDKRILQKETNKKRNEIQQNETATNPLQVIKDKPNRRCVSYQFFKLKFDPSSSGNGNSNPSTAGFDENGDYNNRNKCTCCASSRCPSPRSNDSGMAGSCTIASPDPPKGDFSKFDVEFMNHFHENAVDGDGSKSNRKSGLRYSSSSHNLGRYDVISFNKEHNHDSGQYGESTSLTKDDDDDDDDEEDETNFDIDKTPEHVGFGEMQNIFELSTSRDTVKRSQSAERLLENQSPHNDRRYLMEIGKDSRMDSGGVYKTGLYAHWWKKETLPGAMMRDLIVLKYNRERHGCTGGGNGRLVGWGSGKRMFNECDLFAFFFCYYYFSFVICDLIERFASFYLFLL